MLAPVLLFNISMTGRSHAQRARDAKLKGSSSCKCAMFCIVDVGALPEIPVMFFVSSRDADTASEGQNDRLLILHRVLRGSTGSRNCVECLSKPSKTGETKGGVF